MPCAAEMLFSALDVAFKAAIGHRPRQYGDDMPVGARSEEEAVKKLERWPDSGRLSAGRCNRRSRGSDEGTDAPVGLE